MTARARSSSAGHASDDYGFRSFSVGSGELSEYVCLPGGGSRIPLSPDLLAQRRQYWRFKFRELHAWAVDRIAFYTHDAVMKAGPSRVFLELVGVRPGEYQRRLRTGFRVPRVRASADRLQRIGDAPSDVESPPSARRPASAAPRGR